MKYFVFALTLLVAGASAFPQTNDVEIINKEERLITNTIRQVIREIQNAIRNNGMDPLIIEDFEYRYNIPLFVNIRVYIDSLVLTGPSDIKINDLDYSVLLNRFRFDLELPEIALAVSDSGVDANILGTNYAVSFKGSSSVSRIRLSGEVRVNIGIISGISIRSMSIKFSVGGMSSDIALVVLGNDWSNTVNTMINNTIPEFLRRYENEINQILTDVIRAAADAILG